MQFGTVDKARAVLRNKEKEPVDKNKLHKFDCEINMCVQDYVSKIDIFHLHIVQGKLHNERPEKLKQIKLLSMFRKLH